MCVFIFLIAADSLFSVFSRRLYFVYIDIYAQIKRIHAESQNLLWGSESPRELRCEALRCQLALPALGIQHVECVGIGRIDFHAPVSEFFCNASADSAGTAGYNRNFLSIVHTDFHPYPYSSFSTRIVIPGLSPGMTRFTLGSY